MTTKYVTDGNPDGSVVGQASTDKVGFFGATPVAQQSAITSATAAGGTTAATAVNAVITALRNLGLIAS